MRADAARSHLAIALQALRAHLSESLLMGATFAVIFCGGLTALGLLRSGGREIDSALERFGQDIVHVHDAPSPIGGARPTRLERDDADRLAAAVGGKATLATVSLGAVIAKESRLSAIVVATDPAWGEVNDARMLAGRFLRDGDEAACVLDGLLARDVFQSPGDAVGRKVTLRLAGGERAVTVVGVLEEPLALRERYRDLDALAGARPLLLRVLEGICAYVPRSVSEPAKGHSLCLVRYPEAMSPVEATQRIRDALGEREGSLVVWARKVWIDRLLDMAEFGDVFSSAVWTIVLLLAGAMVMTISLLSISGRSVEMGVRRTQGATRRAICGQIILEGFLVGGCGAIAGVAASPFVGAWLCRRLPWKMALGPEDLALVLGAGVPVILVSYLLPALRAGRLEPMEVLREL